VWRSIAIQAVGASRELVGALGGVRTRYGGIVVAHEATMAACVASTTHVAIPDAEEAQTRCALRDGHPGTEVVGSWHNHIYGPGKLDGIHALMPQINDIDAAGMPLYEIELIATVMPWPGFWPKRGAFII
jgi:hypothetical protein